MTSNINGNALTLEQKIIRRVRNSHFDWEDKTDEEIKKIINIHFNFAMTISMISETLEEMFQK